jgi:hypothetical protein
MSDPTIERKAIELDCKLSSLGVELSSWLAESEAAGTLEKHHTQIRAVARTLNTPIEAVRRSLSDARTQGLLAQAMDLEAMVLELHRIWGFFRDKLALRYVGHFAGPLVAIDELAWRCYQPAQELVANGRGREPPLVYLGGAASPLTIERGKRFERDDDEWAFAAAAIQSLPVPVVGIPWFQVSHLPDTPMIAHEVGHDVEVDLGLTKKVLNLIGAAVPEERRPLWLQWAGEVFADVYGAVAMGPAFSSTLADFLADDREAIAEETRVDGDRNPYPTSALRLLLSAAVLACTGFGDEAARVRARVPPHALPEYQDDVAAVACALIAGPYAAIPGPLTELVGFGDDRWRRARDDSARLLDRTPPEDNDTRVLIAAARHAFDADPKQYVDAEAGMRVIEQITRKRDVGIRGDDDDDPGRTDAAEQRDRDAGKALLAMLDEHTRGANHVQARH